MCNAYATNESYGGTCVKRIENNNYPIETGRWSQSTEINWPYIVVVSKKIITQNNSNDFQSNIKFITLAMHAKFITFINHAAFRDRIIVWVVEHRLHVYFLKQFRLFMWNDPQQNLYTKVFPSSLPLHQTEKSAMCVCAYERTKQLANVRYDAKKPDICGDSKSFWNKQASKQALSTMNILSTHMSDLVKWIKLGAQF